MIHTHCHSSDIALVLCTSLAFYHPLPSHAGRNTWVFSSPNTEAEGRRAQAAYPQEGEVPVVLDAGDLQVAHHHLAVLIVLAQGTVLLLQVRQGAQLVLSASTHCKKTQAQAVRTGWERGTSGNKVCTQQCRELQQKSEMIHASHA